MLEVAGLIFSGIGLLNDLAGSYREFSGYKEKDVLVDDACLPLAIGKEILEGPIEDYRYVPERQVPTAELKGKYKFVHAVNKENKSIARIMIGANSDLRQYLIKKAPNETRS